jgi:hypothetical protein
MDFEECKRSLNITWDDPETDAQLKDDIAHAEFIINEYAGVQIDYSEDKSAAQLFKDCLRYIWNKCLDEFEGRYQPQIVALRTKYEVMAYVSDTETDEVRDVQ